MKSLQQSPMIRLSLAFAAGILLAKYFGISSIVVAGCAGIFGILLLAWDRHLTHRYAETFISVLLLAGMTSLGGIFYEIETTRQKPVGMQALACEQVTLSGVIGTWQKVGKKKNRAIVSVHGVHQNGAWSPIRGKVYLNYSDTLVRPFDSVLIRAFAVPFEAEKSGFHNWLDDQGVQLIAYAKTVQAFGRESGLPAISWEVQQNLALKLGSVIPGKTESAIARAMFLGEKSGLTSELRDHFAGAGLSHILAISGLHVGIIFQMCSWVLALLVFVRHGQKARRILVLVILVIYMFITGGSPAVVRAAVMLITVLIFRLTYYRFHLLNVVAIAALLQMAIEPKVIFEAGFQLSYAAVFGILLFLPVWKKHLATGHKLWDALRSGLAISVIASAATAPIVLMVFGRFPAWFLLGNLLVLPLAGILVTFGFVTVCLAAVPFVGPLLGWISSLLLSALIYIAQTVSALPFAVIERDHIALPAILIIGGQILLASLMVLHPVLAKLLANATDQSPQSYPLPHTV